MSAINQKTIIITGATSGIGIAIANALAEEGAALAITGRNAAAVESLALQITGKARQVVTGVVDVTQEQQVTAFYAKAKEQLGHLDVLLNLPGLSSPGPIEQLKTEDFDQIFDVNVKGAFICAKHFLTQADPARSDLIVNVASTASRKANANAPVYCAAKAALLMFNQGLALQTVDKNVRVTTLSPGPIDTPFWGTRKVPREKFLRPADVVQAVRFILNMPDYVVVHELLFESMEFLKGK